MNNLWQKTPVLIKSFLVGVGLLFPVLMLNTVFIEINLNALWPNVPWSLIFTLSLLWLYWRFATGQPKPFKPSAARKRLSAVRPIKKGNKFWLWMTCIAFVVASNSILILGFLLGNFEEIGMAKSFQRFVELPVYMTISLFFGISLGAGIVEEIALRGYMQTMLLSRYSKLFSYLFIAIFFALAHGLPLLLIMPYMLISIGYSLLTDHLNSVIPAIVVHTAVDFSLVLLVTVGLINLEVIILHNVFVDGLNQTFYASLLVALLAGAIAWFAINKSLTMDIEQHGKPMNPESLFEANAVS